MKLGIALACLFAVLAVAAEEANQPEKVAPSGVVGSDQDPSEQYNLGFVGYNPYGYNTNSYLRYAPMYVPMYTPMYLGVMSYEQVPVALRGRRSVEEKESASSSSEDQKADANVLTRWGYNGGLYNGLAGYEGLAGYNALGGYRGLAGYEGLAGYNGLGGFNGLGGYNGVVVPVPRDPYQPLPGLASYSYSYSHY